MAYEQRWQRFFELLDGNNNGVIDPADAQFVIKRIEVAGLPADNTAKLSVAIQVAITNLLKSSDANTDGKVSRAELWTTVQKLIAAPATPGTTTVIDNILVECWDQVVKATFDAVDANGNGVISEQEFVNIITKLSPSTTAAQVQSAYRNHKLSGAFDLGAYDNLLLTWATSPNPEPDVEILTAFLRKN